jgi:hypothetical protein
MPIIENWKIGVFFWTSSKPGAPGSRANIYIENQNKCRIWGVRNPLTGAVGRVQGTKISKDLAQIRFFYLFSFDGVTA